jgi:hypothetical protein
VQALASLRKRTAAFTIGGRFLDGVGLEVESDAAIATGLYAGASRLGIVLGETSRRAARGGGAVSLKLNLARHGLGRPTAVRLYREDGTMRLLRGTVRGHTLCLETRLKKWECGVIEVVASAI